MHDRQACQILQALVAGVDPATGMEISGESILLNASVLRALLAGAAALKRCAGRAERRARLPDNVGQKWTADHERNLITAFQRGDSLNDIATQQGRTLRGIESRLERLGLLTAEQSTTRR
jgi:hypothetical protein